MECLSDFPITHFFKNKYPNWVKDGTYVEKGAIVFALKAGVFDPDLWFQFAGTSGQVHFVVPDGSKVKKGDLVAKIE